METQGTQSSQNNLKKEEHSWKIHTSQFQNLLQSNQSCTHQECDNGHKDISWNRIDSPDINSQIYGQLIFDRMPRSLNGEK